MIKRVNTLFLYNTLMKLLIDTTGKDLFVSLIKGDKTLSYLHYPLLQKKSDALPKVIKKLLGNYSLKNVDEYFIVKGPGSFMGLRAGLIFGLTAAIINDKKIFTLDSLNFISKGKSGTYFRDASGNNSYEYKNGKYKIIEGTFESEYPFQDIIDNPLEYLSLFKEDKTLDPNYIKEPRVG
ncbi:MAG: hypothetical protein DSZ21_02045 [Tenericutes bacterium]|nr:MAG: hypothetical protein DSZ21_02045 [Mycoplasmatota bacterium]